MLDEDLVWYLRLSFFLYRLGVGFHFIENDMINTDASISYNLVVRCHELGTIMFILKINNASLLPTNFKSSVDRK